MKLHLTATSERGKPVTKSGNDALYMVILNENRERAYSIVATPNNIALYRGEVKGENLLHYHLTKEPKTARERKCEGCDELLMENESISGNRHSTCI